MLKGFEDWDFNIRLGANNFHGKCLNKELFNYNVSRSGMLLNYTLKNYAQIFEYIRHKNSDLYKLGNIIKIYFQWRKLNLIIIFFYFFYIGFFKYFIKHINKLFLPKNFTNIQHQIFFRKLKI